MVVELFVIALSTRFGANYGRLVNLILSRCNSTTSVSEMECSVTDRLNFPFQENTYSRPKILVFGLKAELCRTDNKCSSAANYSGNARHEPERRSGRLSFVGKVPDSIILTALNMEKNNRTLQSRNLIKSD